MTAVLTALALTSGFVQTNKPILIAVRSKVGAAYKYALSTDMNAVGASGKMGFKATISEKLVSRQGDNWKWRQTFDVTSTYANGVFSGSDANFKDMDGLKFDLTTDSTGQTKSMEVNGIKVGSNGTPNVTFSRKAVRVGDKWGAVVETNGMQIKIEYSLRAVRAEKGTRLAVIHGNYLPKQPVVNNGPIVFSVDLADGKLLKAAGAFTVTRGGATVQGKYSLSRL